VQKSIIKRQNRHFSFCTSFNISALLYL